MGMTKAKKPKVPDTGHKQSAPQSEQRLPRINILERSDEVLLRAEVPGVEVQDLEVSISEDQVTIKGHPSSEAGEEEACFHCEISPTVFERTISLPRKVDVSNARAHLKNGILTLAMAGPHGGDEPLDKAVEMVTLKITPTKVTSHGPHGPHGPHEGKGTLDE
jgi:HSP20 family molecular chaperone IbpA